MRFFRSMYRGLACLSLGCLLDLPAVVRLCETVRPDSQVTFVGNEVERGKARAEHRRKRAAALQRLYRVDVPSQGFRFREYDATEKILTLDTRRPLRLSGDVEIVVAGGDDEPELAAAAGPELAEKLVRSRAKNALTLRLLFRLEPGQTGDPCPRSPTKKGMRVMVEPLLFELVETGKAEKVLFRGELPGYKEAVRGTLPVKGPVVRVGRPSLGKEDPPAALVSAVGSLEPALLSCYRDGLKGNVHLRGALVVGFEVDGAGRVAGPRIEIDSLGDEKVAACALEAVRAHRLPKWGRKARLSVPFYFQSKDD